MYIGPMLPNVAVAAMVVAGLVPLPPQPVGVAWPTSQWPAGAPLGVDAAQLEESLSVTRAPQGDLGETRAVVIIQGGRLVAERYMPGFGPETRLISWSMAKSITQALLGIAVRQGRLDIDKPMGNPRWEAGDPRNQIPWRQWINMVDGQAYLEIGAPGPTRNDAAHMLFGTGRLDVAAYAASLPLSHPPGTHWNYNSAGIDLICDGLGRAFAPGAAPRDRRIKVASVLRQELFDPIGMKSAQPEFDAAGTFIGGSHVYATAQDFARFGYLYLRGGVWDGRRILPEGWVDFARTQTPADDSNIYGAGWWITPSDGQGRPFRGLAPGGPKDLFVAQGHEGQLIVVVPSKDLIVVRLGLLQDVPGFRVLGDWVQALVGLFPDVPHP
jgi:CubicO group peptidase (beta-lactamase class C family)